MIIPLVNNFGGVQLPDGAVNIRIVELKKGWFISHLEGTGYLNLILLPAQYKLICVWPKVSEEESVEIIVAKHPYTGNYINYHTLLFTRQTALASLQSLLTSKGLSGTVAILEVLK